MEDSQIIKIVTNLFCIMLMFNEFIREVFQNVGQELLMKVEDYRFSLIFIVFDMINLALAIKFRNDYVPNCNHESCNDDPYCPSPNYPLKDCKVTGEVSTSYKIVAFVWIISCLYRLIMMAFYSLFTTERWKYVKYVVLFVPPFWFFFLGCLKKHERNILYYTTISVCEEVQPEDQAYMQRSLDKVNRVQRAINWALSLLWLVAICSGAAATKDSEDNCITIQHYTARQNVNCTCEETMTGIENHCVDMKDSFMTLITVQCCAFLADAMQKVFFDVKHEVDVADGQGAHEHVQVEMH